MPPTWHNFPTPPSVHMSQFLVIPHPLNSSLGLPSVSQISSHSTPRVLLVFLETPRFIHRSFSWYPGDTLHVASTFLRGGSEEALLTYLTLVWADDKLGSWEYPSSPCMFHKNLDLTGPSSHRLTQIPEESK